MRQALQSKLTVITGGPGVGKTTILSTILRILSVKGARILLAAPTGRAAKRMTEATGLKPAPCTVCLRSIPETAGSSAMRTIRWNAICWWWTKHRWSMCR